MYDLTNRIECYFEFDDYDIEDIFCKVFGLNDWYFGSDQEASRDVSYTFNFIKDRRFGTAYEQRRFSEFLQGRNIGHFRNAMQFLINQDVLPEGKYLIRSN